MQPPAGGNPPADRPWARLFQGWGRCWVPRKVAHVRFAGHFALPAASFAFARPVPAHFGPGPGFEVSPDPAAPTRPDVTLFGDPPKWTRRSQKHGKSEVGFFGLVRGHGPNVIGNGLGGVGHHGQSAAGRAGPRGGWGRWGWVQSGAGWARRHARLTGVCRRVRSAAGSAQRWALRGKVDPHTTNTQKGERRDPDASALPRKSPDDDRPPNKVRHDETGYWKGVRERVLKKGSTPLFHDVPNTRNSPATRI